MGNYDGWITIGTRLDSKQLEKDLKQAEKELQDFKKEQERLTKAKAKVDLSSYEQERAKIQATTDEMLKRAETEKQVENVLSMEKMELDKLEEKYAKQKSQIAEINEALKSNATSQEYTKNKIEDINGKLNRTKKLSDLKGNFSGIGKEANGVSSQLGNIIKKVGKWALAIFSIRSAYSLLTRASSTLQGYNDQYKSNMEYISFVIAQTLAPILEYIQNLLFKILQYINAISVAWFGVNLFANAGADAFQKSQDKLAGANKQAKELKKTLAGFDTANVLGDSSDTSTGSGFTAPSVDLSNLQDVQIPEWVQWIMDHKDEILEWLTAVGVAIGLIKLGEIANNLSSIVGSLSFIQSLGIMLIIAGVIDLVIQLAKYMDKLDGSAENNGTSWEDFGKVMTAVGIIIAGVGLLIGALPVALAGAIAIILGLIVTNWDKIKGWLEKAENFITSKLDWLEQKFGLFGKLIVSPVQYAIAQIKNHFQGMFTVAKNILDGILLIFKGDFANGFKNIGKGILNGLIMIINTFINNLNLILTPIRAVIAEVGSILGKNWSMSSIGIPTISYLRTGGIVNLPGKGVPVGAMAGESGAEGVIPLTDTQAMDKLGESIGRHVAVYVDMTNEIDGRVLNRRLQELNSRKNFALGGV